MRVLIHSIRRFLTPGLLVMGALILFGCADAHTRLIDVNRVQELVNQNDVQKAVLAGREVADNAPMDYRSWLVRAYVHRLAGDTERANSDMARARELFDRVKDKISEQERTIALAKFQDGSLLTGLDLIDSGVQPEYSQR